MDSSTYLDMDNGDREPLFFFLLNAYLQSRIETGNESDGDEEVNVYLAGLLHSLVDGRFYVDNAERLATSPVDVCQKAEASGSDRGKAHVYRTNADHRLMAFGLFSGWGEHTSFYRRTMTPETAYIEEAQQFYSWAALFSARMPARYRGLALTLAKLAEGFDTYHTVLLHMAGSHLNLIRRLTPGQTFHLERAAHEAALPGIQAEALDRMLAAYNAWRHDPTPEARKQLKQAGAAYKKLRPNANTSSLLGEDA